MQKPWVLNSFFDSSKLTGLYEAIGKRQSCRSFASAPSTEQWQALEETAERASLPGVRIQLGMCDDRLFGSFLGRLMKFENVKRFAAVITKDDEPESAVNAGISGEMLVLKAAELGLGSVWVAGTYRHGETGLALQAGESIRAVIALGVPAQPAKLPIQRKRKPLTVDCPPDFAGAPGVCRDIAAAIQAAPSALNAQPWRVQAEGMNTLAISVSKPGQRVDLGIAVCHSLLALGATPAQFTLEEDGLTAHIIF